MIRYVKIRAEDEVELNPDGEGVEASERPYLTIFDIQLGQYRVVNLSTVTGSRAGGKSYMIID